MTLTRDQWRILAKTLQILGGGCCIVVFLTFQILIAYYSVKRPHVPRPQLGWTVRLYWSWAKPSYGTAQEEALLLSLFRWFFPPFLIICAGRAIEYFKLNINIFKNPNQTL
jgi:hypothetical protein